MIHFYKRTSLIENTTSWNLMQCSFSKEYRFSSKKGLTGKRLRSEIRKHGKRNPYRIVQKYLNNMKHVEMQITFGLTQSCRHIIPWHHRYVSALWHHLNPRLTSELCPHSPQMVVSQQGGFSRSSQQTFAIRPNAL